jgi:hypothetical protein
MVYTGDRWSLRKDIERFFSRRMTKAVLDKLKSLQDADFVCGSVESVMSKQLFADESSIMQFSKMPHELASRSSVNYKRAIQ